jgi:RimJ/RimL family protein N-acetyltransferase
LTESDLPFAAEMLADAEVMRFWPRPYTRAEALDWIHRQKQRYATDGYGYWLALEDSTGQPVGQAGLLAQEIAGVREAGLGYIMHRPYWRRGYALECAQAISAWAFAVLDQRSVIATIRPENLPSIAVARKLGMRPDPRTTTIAGFHHLVYVLLNPARSNENARIGTG